MTKKELEKKRDEICLKLANEFYPDSRMWDSRDGNFFNGAKAGFDSAVALLMPRLEEAEKVVKFYAEGNHLNEEDHDIVHYECEGSSMTDHLVGRRARQYFEKKNNSKGDVR